MHEQYSNSGRIQVVKARIEVEVSLDKKTFMNKACASMGLSDYALQRISYYQSTHLDL